MLTASLWLGAWLRGTAAPDDVLGALAGAAPEAVAGDLLGAIRAVRAERAWLLLPRPGRALAWPGAAPGDKGPTVLVTATDGSGALVRPAQGRWTVVPAGPADLPALEGAALTDRQARRAFEAAVLESAGAFEALGLERAPTVTAPARWAAALRPAPPGVPPAALHVLHRAATVLDALDSARADDGAAVTAGEAAARASAVRRLAGELEDLVVAIVGGLNPRPGSVGA